MRVNDSKCWKMIAEKIKGELVGVVVVVKMVIIVK